MTVVAEAGGPDDVEGEVAATTVAEPGDPIDPIDPIDPMSPTPVRWPERLVLVVGAIALAVAVVATRWGVFTPDTQPDLYQDPGGFLRASLQAWIGGVSGMGQGNFNAGAAPVGAVVWVIRALGVEPWLAVRVWRLLLLLVAAWGIRRYLGALMGRRLSAQARVLATVFFVVNPYVIVAGNTTPILLPYALLPWTMLALLKATRDPRSWRWPALFGLAFFAQSGLNAGVVPFFQLLAVPAHLAYARWAEGRSWGDLWRVLWRCGASALTVSLYWILPAIVASGTGAGIASGTENPTDVARTSSYAETARLLGNWPLYGRAGDRRFLGGYTIYLTSVPVVLATFAVPLAVGLALWQARARERLLVVGLAVVALPVMVGIFPPDDPSPAGRGLLGLFERVPAAMAFRTTNKVGAVVVLAWTVALVLGWRAWQARSLDRGRLVRWPAGVVVVALLVGMSAPMWNGDLYPLGYTIPDTWQDATSDLDEVRPDQRVLAVPGGTGGNYRWGMRSPDDLFPSLLDRPHAARNTVIGRGDPAGNLLSAFDVALAQGALTEGQLSTTARYLGAGDVLVRNDTLSEEAGGPVPAVVVAQADADPDLTETATYGRPGHDTVPGRSGRATARARRLDPANARLHPLITYQVTDPIGPVRAAEASRQVLVVGDGEALVGMGREGIVDGTQPLQFLADLDDDAFAAAVDRGGRVVLTDTNRRRAWDINRVANATSATLTVEEDIDGGNGATTTRWPDQPEHQTVAEITRGVALGASRPGFGLHPFGRPANAFDGDPGTAWITGGFGTGTGSSIWIELPERRRIEQVTILPQVSEPSRLVAVRVRVGSNQVTEAMDPSGRATRVQIAPTTASRVEVTILQQTPGDNPVGIAEIDIEGTTVRNVTRLPTTLSALAASASEATLDRLAELPLDIVLTRARGAVREAFDDEEFQLDRRFDLPMARSFAFTATASTFDTDADAVAAARAGDRACHEVAVLDGERLEARIVSTAEELSDGLVRVESCAPVELDAGRHELQSLFGWRLDTAHFASPGATSAGPADGASTTDAGEPALRVTDRSSTRVEMDLAAGDGDRVVRLGQAYDERWSLTVDGADAGPPIVVDGYSVGWIVDGDAHRLVARFGPQRAVQATFVASAVSLVGVTAIALLPTPALFARRRRGDEGPTHDEPTHDEPAHDGEEGP